MHRPFAVTLPAASVLAVLSLSLSGDRLRDPEAVAWTHRTEAEPVERRPASDEHYRRMLADPETGEIPRGIRNRETRAARTRHAEYAAKRGSVSYFDWTEASPPGVGGRTRALAADLDRPDVVLAGGASGGLWKSSDAGRTWKMASSPDGGLQVTSLVQDPRPGHTDTWYYGTGEYGSSTRAPMSSHHVAGTGIYRSDDGGETWSVLPATSSSGEADEESPFSYVSRLVVHPVSGALYVASNQFGVLRSGDGGESFLPMLGGPLQHNWSDVAVTASGRVIALLSTYDGGDPSQVDSPGIHQSTDDGATWSDVTPAVFPASHGRGVLAVTAADPDLVFVLVNQEDDLDPMGFYRIDLASGQAEDRSANIRDLSMLGAYAMLLAVKPDDVDTILIGGITLYRSRDGFTSTSYTPAQAYGTYDNGLWVDQHVAAFDPGNPNRVWIGDDGGVSVTDDVTATTILWKARRLGYHVTQFYTIGISGEEGDWRIMGGTQDRGTPFYRAGSDFPARDASGSDGGQVAFASHSAYTAPLFGPLSPMTRRAYVGVGEPLGQPVKLHPPSTPPLWIVPFVIDPVGEDVIFRSGDPYLLRLENQATTTGEGRWRTLTGMGPTGLGWITALAVSTEPAHVLYYGVFAPQTGPEIHRLDHADVATGGKVDVSIPGLPELAYPVSIAVNPADADEILVAFSNYNLAGLYHSTDGGASYAQVEGNLEGTPDAPGPSIRSATILPSGGDTFYIVGTSTGLYSTARLEGTATAWHREAAESAGLAVVTQVTSRPSDGWVVAGTHGRGAFGGFRNATPVAMDGTPDPAGSESTLSCFPDPFASSLTVRFDVPIAGPVRLDVHDAVGRLVATLIDDVLPAGPRMTSWSPGEAVPSGSYLVRLSTPGGVTSRIVVRVRP